MKYKGGWVWSVNCTYVNSMKTTTVQKLFAFTMTLMAASLGLASMGSAKLNPTIYYIKSIQMDKQNNCGTRKNIRSTEGKILYTVCENEHKTCVIEGTCAIIDDEVTVINYIQEKQGIYQFEKVDKDKCPFGLGVKNICLDPYYTVAADLNFHNPGDVIFVDEMKGVKLPNGEVHDGFFIVRDKGGAIKGANRFDFYTGLLPFKSDENPFTPLGFANSKSSFPYRKATASETLSVKKSRHYPGVPL